MLFLQIEKRWLGSIRFPFNTLYATGRIDGVFELDTPFHHIGYTKNMNKSNKVRLCVLVCMYLCMYTCVFVYRIEYSGAFVCAFMRVCICF